MLGQLIAHPSSQQLTVAFFYLISEHKFIEKWEC